MTQENQQTQAKTKEQLWAELDAAEGGNPSTAAQSTQQLSDADLEAAAANASTRTDEQHDALQEAAHQAAPEGTAAATDATSTSQDDPYAALPQAARDEINGLKSMVEQLGTRLRNAEGHIGGINHQLKQASKAAASTRAEGHAAPTQEQLAAARSNNAALAKLKEEYPEFGAALEAVLKEERQAGASPQGAENDAPELNAPGNGLTQQQLLEQIEELKRELTVESAHPGWKQRVATPAFRGWLARQSREVQLLGASSDPGDAIRLLDLHATAAKQSQHKQQRLDAAAALPNGRTAAGARPKDPSTMTKAEYWAYLDQQEAQQARG